ncbi:MAG: alpha/beta hydrolase [Pseudomonadota bacterium]
MKPINAKAEQSGLHSSLLFWLVPVLGFSWARWAWAVLIILSFGSNIVAASDIEGLMKSRGAEFRSTPCWFELAPEQIDHRRYSCGEFAVPEHWEKPSSRQIHLPVVTFHAKDTDAAGDPVVFINGGPGGRPFIRDAEAIDRFWLPFLRVQSWRQKRDLIVVGLRGTNWTDSNLDCPETDDLLASDASPEAGNANRSGWSDTLYLETITACMERLAEDHDLSGYNIDQNVRDIASLRIAMDIDRWSLLGTSYGTRLALKIVRDFPDGIETVVLDSVVPIDFDPIGSLAANLEETLERLFQACRSDETCNRRFPDSKNQLKNFLARTADENLKIKIEDHHVHGTFFLPLTPLRTAEILWALTFSPLRITFIPFLIDALDRGYAQDFVAGMAELSSSTFDGVAKGPNFIQTCNDSLHELIEFDRQAVEESDLIPSGLFTQSLDMEIALCKRFATDPLPPDRRQVAVSDIPALLLSGYFDAAKPPKDAIQAGKSLSKAYHFTFPDRTHGVLFASPPGSVDGASCPSRIVSTFLDNPEERPNDPCLQHLDKLTFPPDEVYESVIAEAHQDGSPKLENQLADDWSGVRSERNANEVNVVFRNQTSEAVAVYWIDFEGQRKPYGVIDPAQEKRQHTYQGHRWELQSVSGELLGRFIAIGVDSVAELSPKED